MMNIVQACGVIAKMKGDSVVVATMLSMFIFDRIEGAAGNATGVPLVGGKAGLVLGLGVAKMKTVFSPAAAASSAARSPPGPPPRITRSYIFLSPSAELPPLNRRS